MGLDTVELIMEFEKAFDIQVPDATWERTSTVGDAYNVVWQHLEHKPGHGMSRKEMEELMKDIIEDKVGVDRSEITPEKSFVDDLGMD